MEKRQGPGWLDGGRGGIIGKNLIREDGQTERFQALEIGWWDGRSGRIVRIDDHDGPGVGLDQALQCREIEVPGPVITQRILPDFDRFQIGQELKQRIGWARSENPIAGVGQELEKEGIRLAGTGGQEDLGSPDPAAAAGIIVDHGVARGIEAAGRRIVMQCLGIGQSG